LFNSGNENNNKLDANQFNQSSQNNYDRNYSINNNMYRNESFDRMNDHFNDIFNEISSNFSQDIFGPSLRTNFFNDHFFNNQDVTNRNFNRNNNLTNNQNRYNDIRNNQGYNLNNNLKDNNDFVQDQFGIPGIFSFGFGFNPTIDEFFGNLNNNFPHDFQGNFQYRQTPNFHNYNNNPNSLGYNKMQDQPQQQQNIKYRDTKIYDV